MSSVMTRTCPCANSTSPKARYSASEYVAPVGLLGELISSQRVRGVIAACKASGVSLKPLASGQGTMAGMPSEASTMSG